jgi:hypothetical protein
MSSSISAQPRSCPGSTYNPACLRRLISTVTSSLASFRHPTERLPTLFVAVTAAWVAEAAHVVGWQACLDRHEDDRGWKWRMPRASVRKLTKDARWRECRGSLEGGAGMRPLVWRPPVELSSAEQAIAKMIRRTKLFVFLHQRRHELFGPVF